MSVSKFLTEIYHFTIKEARASLFAGLFLCLLLVSNYIHIDGIYRYDMLFVSAVAIQILLLVFKLETRQEAKVIFLFHIIGLILEIYKTNPAIGSWSYPEAGYLKIMNVPLYSGFMYSSIGSYITQAWRFLKLRLINPPKYTYSVLLCVLIYLNFFTNHFIKDFRDILMCLIAVLYFRTWVCFTPHKTEFKMPLLLGFGLTAFFVWIAENIGTFTGAWKYPNQIHEWNVVSFQKITSWFLMIIISFIIVSYIKHRRESVL